MCVCVCVFGHEVKSPGEGGARVEGISRKAGCRGTLCGMPGESSGGERLGTRRPGRVAREWEGIPGALAGPCEHPRNPPSPSPPAPGDLKWGVVCPVSRKVREAFTKGYDILRQMKQQEVT